MRYSIVQLTEDGTPYTFDVGEAFYYFEDELLPDHQEEIDSAIGVEDGLEMFSISKAPGSHYGERNDVFMIYESHPLFNFVHILDTLTDPKNRFNDDYAISLYAVAEEQLKNALDERLS